MQPMFAFDRQHRLFSSELKKYSSPIGVHYARWQKQPQRLEKYLKQLASISQAEYDTLSAADKEALWLDAYEAFTIKIVLDHYPIQGTKPYYPPGSLRQIPDVWESFSTRIAGRTVNLYQIEHEYIRKAVKDSRAHFALACGARGCCATPPFAYTANKLETELDHARDVFLSKRRNVDIDPKTHIVLVSQVFKWFPLDFAADAGFEKPSFPPPTDDEIILSYLSRFGPPTVRSAIADLHERASYKVAYRDFDWSLNDADAECPDVPAAH